MNSVIGGKLVLLVASSFKRFFCTLEDFELLFFFVECIIGLTETLSRRISEATSIFIKIATVNGEVYLIQFWISYKAKCKGLCSISGFLPRQLAKVGSSLSFKLTKYIHLRSVGLGTMMLYCR